MVEPQRAKFTLSNAAMKAYRGILDLQLEELRGFRDQADYSGAKKVLHKIKGSAALFGNEAMSIACKEAEGIDPSTEESRFLARIDLILSLNH